MRRANDTLRTACITVLGSGFMPFASGTWGSLVAVALWIPLWWFTPRGVLELLTVAGILVASVLSVRWGGWAIARFGRADPKPFVLDEFAGQWVALLALPCTAASDFWTWAYVVGGQFLLFRACDIIKPPPARQAERLPAGWGVLLDDIFAGIYANAAGQLLWRLTPVAAALGVHRQ